MNSLAKTQPDVTLTEKPLIKPDAPQNMRQSQRRTDKNMELNNLELLSESSGCSGYDKSIRSSQCGRWNRYPG